MTIVFRSPSRRRVLGYGAAGVAALGMPSIARAQGQTVRIGLPTKTYYPTIIAETALRQKLFEKEGIKAELTIYRGVERESYSCMPICQRRVTLGDGDGYFKTAIDQAGSLSSQAAGSAAGGASAAK